MKNERMKKIINIVLTLLIVVLAGRLAWDYFEVGNRFRLASAVDDLLAARNPMQARDTLRGLQDREGVVAALKRALDEDTDSVAGKVEILNTLVAWREERAARRAVSASSSISTRRAAAWLFHGSEEMRDDVRAVTLDWIRDGKGDSRHLATILVGRLDLKEAEPALMEALELRGRDPGTAEFRARALDALVQFETKGLGPRVLAIARDASEDWRVRGRAFDVLARIPDAPIDEVRALLIQVLSEPAGDSAVRQNAATALRRPEYANAQALATLEEVLVRSRDDHVVQRSCLWALGEVMPLDALAGLLLRREVSSHPYFAIRSDVATAVGAMNLRRRLVLDLLSEYLVDDDPLDTQRLVRQEAWLTLWSLTGIAYDLPENLFGKPPLPIRDEKDIRYYLWRWGYQRPGVSSAMTEEVRKRTDSLETMKRVRDTYSTNLIPQIMKRWEEEAKAAEEQAKEKPQGVPEMPQGD